MCIIGIYITRYEETESQSAFSASGEWPAASCVDLGLFSGMCRQHSMLPRPLQEESALLILLEESKGWL